MQQLTSRIIGAAIEVHQALGPGLLESAYEECLAHEMRLRGLRFLRQISLPVAYKGVNLDCAYRLDFLVDEHRGGRTKVHRSFIAYSHSPIINLPETGQLEFGTFN